jgi:hypothetical protein
MTDSDAGADADTADTFGVGIHVTDADLQFVVHVPSDIDSGWRDPEEFQRLVEEVVWDRLDRRRVLETVAADTPAGETVTLGRVTLRPDGTVVRTDLSPPAADEA